MRFLVPQEPNIRRSKKVNFFSVSFGRVPPKKVKIVSICLLRIGKRKEWRKQNSYHTILVCSVPNKERTAQLSIAQHIDRLTSSAPFSREPNIRKIKVPKLHFQAFSSVFSATKQGRQDTYYKLRIWYGDGDCLEHGRRGWLAWHFLTGNPAGTPLIGRWRWKKPRGSGEFYARPALIKRRWWWS